MASDGIKRWVGRVALVTGASTTYGAGICKKLVKEGMKVIGCDMDLEKLKGIVNELVNAPGEIYAMKCDLSSEQEIDAMFQNIRSTFGRLDVFISSAWLARDSPLLTGIANDWRQVIEVNIIALSICSRETVKLMVENNIEDGQIIHIDCITGVKFPEKEMPSLSFFGTTKSVVKTLTERLRREIRTSSQPGIRVASITQGEETDFSARSDAQESAGGLYKLQPCLQPWLQPADIAQAVTYILKTPAHVEVNDIVL